MESSRQTGGRELRGKKREVKCPYRQNQNTHGVHRTYGPVCGEVWLCLGDRTSWRLTVLTRPLFYHTEAGYSSSMMVEFGTLSLFVFSSQQSRHLKINRDTMTSSKTGSTSSF